MGVAGVAWRPRPTGFIVDGRLLIEELVAGSVAFIHGVGIKERLDGRTDLTAAGRHHVVLEEVEVGASDVGLDVAIDGVHRHEAGAEYVLVVKHRIARRHDGIDEALVVVGKDCHGDGSVKLFVNLLFGGFVELQYAHSLSVF